MLQVQSLIKAILTLLESRSLATYNVQWLTEMSLLEGIDLTNPYFHRSKGKESSQTASEAYSRDSPALLEPPHMPTDGFKNILIHNSPCLVTIKTSRDYFHVGT